MPSLLLKISFSCFLTDFESFETKIMGQQGEAILTKMQNDRRQNMQSKSMPPTDLTERNTEKALECLKQN
jgi:hypothetical protein